MVFTYFSYISRSGLRKTKNDVSKTIFSNGQYFCLWNISYQQYVIHFNFVVFQTIQFIANTEDGENSNRFCQTNFSFFNVRRLQNGLNSVGSRKKEHIFDEFSFGCLNNISTYENNGKDEPQVHWNLSYTILSHIFIRLGASDFPSYQQYIFS